MVGVGYDLDDLERIGKAAVMTNAVGPLARPPIRGDVLLALVEVARAAQALSDSMDVAASGDYDGERHDVLRKTLSLFDAARITPA